MSRFEPGVREISWRVALTHPIDALRFLLGNRSPLQDEIVLHAAKILCKDGFQAHLWQKALSELQKEDLLPPQVDYVAAGNSHRTTLGKWLYALVRSQRPDTIVETGVSHGVSSWLILNALAKNDHGFLYSIDLPNKDTNKSYNVADVRSTGCAVPERLRSRWKLLLGDTRVLLPDLLADLGQVDIFFHDSDHSYGVMIWEFGTVFSYISNKGFVVADDVQRNRAFRDWVQREHLIAVQFRKGGVARRRVPIA